MTSAPDFIASSVVSTGNSAPAGRTSGRAAEMIQILRLMPESAFDERFQSRIVPVRTFDFASRGSEIKRCQMAASEMLGEIGRG